MFRDPSSNAFKFHCTGLILFSWVLHKDRLAFYNKASCILKQSLPIQFKTLWCLNLGELCAALQWDLLIRGLQLDWSFSTFTFDFLSSPHQDSNLSKVLFMYFISNQFVTLAQLLNSVKAHLWGGHSCPSGLNFS